MKYNIKRTNYHGKPCKNGKWWSWDEKCDRCGADCKHTGIMTTERPQMDEADFCIQCYRDLIEQKIPYKQAYEMYKK